MKIVGRSANLLDVKNIDWIPSLNLGYNQKEIDQKRADRLKGRDEIKTQLKYKCKSGSIFSSFCEISEYVGTMNFN